MYPSARLFTPWGTTACCAAMIGMGLLWAAYGPAIPQLQRQFGTDEFGAGLPLAVQSVGSVVGALLVPVLLGRLGYRSLFGLAFAALAAGAIVIGSLPAWAAVMVGAVIAGVGLGVCDTLVSQSFIVGHRGRGAAMVNVAHGCFGVGTVLAPVLVAMVGVQNWPVMFLVVGALMVIAATGLPGISTSKGLPRISTRMEGHRTLEAPASGGSSGRVGFWVILGFLVVYVAHFGVQSGIGSWGPTRLMDEGSTEMQATLATSGYWLAMVVGRVAAIPFATLVRPSLVVIASASGMTVAVGIAALVPGATVWAYLLAGLMIGPIFPTGLTWLHSTGHARGGTFSYVVASALAGSILIPPLLGALFRTWGSGALAPTLVVVSLVAVAAAVTITLLMHDRPAERLNEGGLASA
ncbi:MFS transporter [Nocardioides sp. BGMRC 2183]|nr:MFS transporter [Nocardioides sp. BGMRC 2183]